MIAPALTHALASWLDHCRALGGAAENTVKAYQSDVLGFLAFMTQHHGEAQGLGPLSKITVSDMRAWMASERTRGVGARSLARQLSAVKTFYRWLSDREGFEPTAVLSTRSPKLTKKLPRPLAEDAATRDDRHGRDASNRSLRLQRVIVRSLPCFTAVALRISEALSLTGADVPLPQVMRITGKGGKERIVPVIDAAREAVASYFPPLPASVGTQCAAVSRCAWWPTKPAGDTESHGTVADAAWLACHRHTARDAP